MKYSLDRRVHTLRTYYNIIMEENYRKGLCETDNFLDFCFDRAKVDFESENHAAIEYDNSYANVIIETAEMLEDIVKNDTLEEDWNSLFTMISM